MHQLTDSGSRAIFVQPELVPVLEEALKNAPSTLDLPSERVFLLCQYEHKPAGTPYKCVSELYDKQGIPKQVSGDAEKDTTYLCYSSGTTGRAKGVETTHHNLTSQVQAINVNFEPLGIHDRMFGTVPFGHIYGLALLLHFPMTLGVPVIIVPKFEPELALRTIQNVSKAASLFRQLLLIPSTGVLSPSWFLLCSSR